MAFAVLAIVPFVGAIGADFVFDDQTAVLGNELVTGDLDLLGIFQRDFWGREAANSIGSYRPLAVLTFVLDFRLGGGAPWAFHLTNLLLHGAACATLFAYLAKRGGRTLAAAATSLFAVHALHTENVLAIVGRADVLATIFVLVTLGVARGASRRAWLTGPAFFAALLSKEIAVAALAVLLADFLLNLDPKALATRRSRLIGLASMVVAFAAYMLLRYLAMGLIEAPVRIQGNPLLDASTLQRLYTSAALITRSIGLLLVPWTLIADYSTPAIMPETSFLALDVVLGFLLSLVLAVTMWVFRKRQPGIVWGAAIIAASYIPVSNLLVLVPTIFAERLLYLPSLGFCVILAQLFILGRKKKNFARAASVLFGIYMAMNMVRSSIRTTDWRTDRDLFTAAVDTNPISLLSRLRMGEIERQAGNLDAAAYQFDQAIQLAPTFGDSYTQLGITLDLMNEPKQAHPLMRQAVRIAPQCIECVTALVTFYLKYGRFEAAEAEIVRLERVAPKETEVTMRLRAQYQDVLRKFNDQ